MRRLVICQNYSFFDRAEKYILYLLQSFAEFADRIIVLNNSKLKNEEKRKYQNLSDEYYERENLGYDAGAYKDFFQNNTVETIGEWDEIVLTNSTFFGPLYSWKEVFSRMNEVECDFWGLSRHIGGGKMLGTEIPPHLQSYFIVIKNKMLADSRFFNFWSMMEYPKSYKDAVIKFEWGFTRYFTGLGYKFSTYLEQNKKGNALICAGGDASAVKAYELISECKFPIIKCKHIAGVCQYKQAVDVLNYIKQNTKYDVDMIYNYIDMLDKEDKLFLSKTKTLDFMKKYSDIYVFGHGLYAKNVAFFLKEQGYQVKNFIVSVPVNEDEIALKNIDDFKGKGVIVALGMQAFTEVKDILVNAAGAEHLLIPNY